MALRKKIDKRGQSLVEIALLLPLLLFILLAVADFGRAIYWVITLSHATRAGAAYGGQSVVKAADSSGIQQAAQEEAQNIGSIAVNSRRICECPGDNNAICTNDCPEEGFGPPRVFVEVTTSTTFRTLFPYPGIPNPMPLSRICTIRVQ